MEGIDDGPIDSSKMKNILQSVAEKSPDRYRDISHAILKMGAKTSNEVPTSFSLEDLKSPIDMKSHMGQIALKENAILSDKSLTPKQRNGQLIKLYGEQSNSMPDIIYRAAQAKDSNLARMVASGARGNKGQLNSNIGADWLMLDANSDPIPVPIKHSYAEGLSPAEYFASAYGTRRGLLSTKFSVQQSGYLSKQLSAAAHDLVVSEKDCDTHRGYPTSPDDKDNIGAVMAVDAGGFPAGTVVTSRVLSQLKSNGVSKMTVRSPLTCTAKNGVCATCAGVGARNKFPEIGERVGLAAASSVGEPLSQSTLSEKHSGGVASSSGKAVSAFKSIDALVQVPDNFPNGATVASNDGRVTKVEAAPQGGSYIYVGDKQHYVAQGMDPKVKMGDTVEAGDSLSSGVPNPYDIVKHKGVGQGRVYFVDALRDTLRSNNISADRRQLEFLGRALVNHVKVTDPEGYGSHLPDDVIEYSAIEQDFEPENSFKSAPGKAEGKYLARPTLHYSLGTRITPSVIKGIEDGGEKEIDVMDLSPGFEPEMQRVMDNPSFKPDWLAQFAGSGLKKRMLQNVHSGDAYSDPNGASYIPSLAKGVGFGDPVVKKPVDFIKPLAKPLPLL
jgi:DNA-directed RNA polymerase subunit beta'